MHRFLESLDDSAARLAAALRAGPLDAAIAACPGWTLADLGRHMGFIHRWARLAASGGEAPDTDRIEPPPPDAGLADWVEVGAADLVALLAAQDPDAPTWHPFPAPRTVGVWARRQAHETLIHAWDAEAAIGEPTRLDPAMAADDVDEYFGVMIPRRLQRTGQVAPAGVLLVRCTDTGDEVVVRSDGPTVALDPAAVAEVELAAPAADLALALWGRRPLVDPPRHPLVTAWLAFGGN